MCLRPAASHEHTGAQAAGCTPHAPMLAAAQHFYLGLDQVSAAVNHGQLAFVHDLHGVQLARALVHSTLHDRERPTGGWTTGVVHVNTSSALRTTLDACPCTASTYVPSVSPIW